MVDVLWGWWLDFIESIILTSDDNIVFTDFIWVLVYATIFKVDVDTGRIMATSLMVRF